MIASLIYFGLTFLIVYCIYYFRSVKKAKKDIDKMSVETKYLVLKYNINLKKINYKSFLNVVAITGSFDIALVAFIISFFNNIFIQLLIGFLVLIPVILISFSIIGNHYKDNSKLNNKKKGDK